MLYPASQLRNLVKRHKVSGTNRETASVGRGSKLSFVKLNPILQLKQILWSIEFLQGMVVFNGNICYYSFKTCAIWKWLDDGFWICGPKNK